MYIVSSAKQMRMGKKSKYRFQYSKTDVGIYPIGKVKF